MKYTFTKDKKLVSSNDFKKLFESNNKVKTENFVIFVLKNNLNMPRLGVIVKRNAKCNSIKRNRIKRLVRETFRLEQYEFKINSDILVSVYKDCSGSKQQDIAGEINSAWAKLGIL
jgi:ribonuclease P protein component